MSNFLKSASLILFIVIFIGFAFPFITKTYPNGNLASSTGFDLLTSIKQEVLNDPENNPADYIPVAPTINNENTIALSALSASVGIATTQLRSPQAAIVTAIAAGLGAGALWQFKDRNEQVVLQGEERVEAIDFGSGFFTCWGSYLAAFAINLWRFFQRYKR